MSEKIRNGLTFLGILVVVLGLLLGYAQAMSGHRPKD
jgi:hypothetical protein